MKIVLGLAMVLLLGGCADNCDTTSEPVFSCEDEEDTCIPAPENCSGEQPETAELHIFLSKPLPRLVRVYQGAAHETGTLVESFAPESADFFMHLPLGTYSVTALYVRGNDSVLAVDGTELGSLTLDTCTKKCLAGSPGEVDLTLD